MPSITQDSLSPAVPEVLSPDQPLATNVLETTIEGSHAEDQVSIRLYLDENQNSELEKNEVIKLVSSEEGRWVIATTLLENSLHHYYVSAIDQAGNESEAVAIPLITHDNIGPLVYLANTLAESYDTGRPRLDFLTNEEGSVMLGGACGTSSNTAITKNSFTLQLSQLDGVTPLENGTYSDCSIHMVDTIGNQGMVLPLESFTIFVNTEGVIDIQGILVEGKTLSLHVEDEDGFDTLSSVMWTTENGTVIGSEERLLIDASLIGERVRAFVSYTDLRGTEEQINSELSAAIISKQQVALNLIADYHDNPSAVAPTLADFTTAGLQGMTKALLSIMHYAVSHVDQEQIQTPEALQSLLDTILLGQDEDNDGLPNFIEGSGEQDADGDGVANYKDVDSDSDGLPDTLESGLSLLDSDEDGVIDVFDADVDADGLLDAGKRDDNLDGVNDAVHAFINRNDTDEDGVMDVFDADVDADGLLDAGKRDDNLDGVNDAVHAFINRNDTDEDGVMDVFDVDEYVSDQFDVSVLDADNDGRLDGFAQLNLVLDADNDGLFNSQDLDSDNDGLLDIQENQGFDADGNGLLDEGEAMSEMLLDSDGDQLPDVIDVMSVGSEMDIASTALAQFDENQDGQLDQINDDDRDGIMLLTDGAPFVFWSKLDADGDALAFHSDPDDDNDGILDEEEGKQSGPLQGPVDEDNDGIDDSVDYEVNGLIQGEDTNNNGINDTFESSDLDSDGTPDYLDSDADNDGVHDADDLIVSLNDDYKATGDSTGSMDLIALLALLLLAGVRYRKLVLPLMLSLLGMASVSHSEDWSVNLSAGISQFSPDISSALTLTQSQSTAYQVGVSYRWNNYIASQISYADLGSSEVQNKQHASRKAEVAYKAYSMSLKLREPEWQLKGLVPFVVLGVGSIRTATNNNGLRLADDNQIDAQFGVGFAKSFGPLGIHSQYQWFNTDTKAWLSGFSYSF